MYGEIPYGFVPYGESQSVTVYIDLNDSTTVVDQLFTVELDDSIYIWLEEQIQTNDSLTREIEIGLNESVTAVDSLNANIVTFSKAVKGSRYFDKIKGCKIKVEINSKKHA